MKINLPRPERNDPCLCRSGRKYKKCCLERVQKSTETIRRAAGAPAAARFPRLVELLGLACGIQGGPPEMVPDPEKAGRAVAAFYQNMAGASDEAALNKYLEELGQRLGPLLRQNPLLRFLRFPLSRLEEHFAERGEPGGRDEEALLEEAERGLFTPEFASDAAIVLANAFCLGEGSAADLEALAGVLALLVEEGDVDFIGRLVLAVTLEELKAFDEELAKINAGKKDDAAIAELCERYPALERELSRRYVREIRPVLDKIASGEIPVSIPFYAVVNGFLALDQVARPAISAAAAGKVERLAEALIGVAESFLTPSSPLEEAIFVKDYYFFAREAIKSLQSWLAKNQDSSLRAGVERLLGGFWDTRFSAGRLLLTSLYKLAMRTFIEAGTLRLPGPEGELAIDVLKIEPEKLMAYARCLEKEDLAEAAEHVRKALGLAGAKNGGEFQISAEEACRRSKEELENGAASGN